MEPSDRSGGVHILCMRLVGEDSGDESELESESEDWSSSEEDSDEEGLEDSVCPPGCDPALYELAIQSRDRKLDVEEALTG